MAIIRVRQAREAAGQWVAQTGSRSAGFSGAFLHGSINWLDEDDPISPTSDVDVILVHAGPTVPPHIGKFRHYGVLLDVSFLPADEIRTAETVLGNSHLAGSLRGASLIADPTGRLSELQATVAQNYARREWVVRRCEHARSKILTFLYCLDPARPLHDNVTSSLFGAGCTTHVLLVAGLRNPTVRSRFVAVRKLLTEYGHLDVHGELLELLGSAHLERPQVEHHLATMTEVFDAAKLVIRTPVFFASDISDLARPIAIDGSRELIESGFHREAMFWIAATWSRCMTILSADAPPELRDQFTPGFQATLADLGIASFADMAGRRRKVRAYLPRLMSIGNDIIDANPDVARLPNPLGNIQNGAQGANPAALNPGRAGCGEK